MTNPTILVTGATGKTGGAQSRMESVVQLSQWLSGPNHPALATRQTWLIDQIFGGIPGIAHTIVNPGYFADNYLRLMDFAAVLGVLPVLTGDSKNAPPANEDIARVAVAALADPGRHAGKRYRPTGPRLMSAFDMAPAIGNTLGRRVRAHAVAAWRRPAALCPTTGRATRAQPALRDAGRAMESARRRSVIRRRTTRPADHVVLERCCTSTRKGKMDEHEDG